MSASVIVVARNAMHDLPECLTRICNQSYDGLLEILLIDGGSTDGTIEYATSVGAKVIDGGHSENQEARRYIGSLYANGDVLVYLDADNYLPDNDWLMRMMVPFSELNVVCSFTKWYGIDESLSMIDKYYALLGGNDPVAYYLGKQDRVTYGSHGLPWGAIPVYEKNNIEFVRFYHDKIPTLGCNGFLIRKTYMEKIRYKSADEFYHTDVHVDLLSNASDVLYAIVPTTIIHNSGGTLLRNLKKRLKYKHMHSDRMAKFRKYRVFDPSSWRDRFLLVLTIFIGLTLILPMLRAMAGYVKTGRFEWFIHPVATLSMIVAYGYSVIYGMVRSIER